MSSARAPREPGGPGLPDDPFPDGDPYLIKVTVRDARLGRDPARVTAEGGEVLAFFESEFPYRVGDVLQLPEGEHVVVVEVRERITRRGWFQLVHAGDHW